MVGWNQAKLRDDETWAEIRRGWERGETGGERATDRPWAGAVWDSAGQMRDLESIDWEIIRLHRDDWRREAGLPEGAAPHYP